ncbi:hypothetical protein DL771_000919 [Monosporascus sp. 5C6A]|nr:hypothetical protein DL771_000919 [Monosporascus sp. 5C6A]
MKVLTGVSLLASLASAVSVDLGKRDSPLDVKLEMVGNTAVKASITNNGETDLKLFKTGSFLDEAAVEKVDVFQANSKLAFEGIRLRALTTDLAEDVFETIGAGATLETTFDIAHTYDLSGGGAVDLSSEGVFAYAEPNTTEIVGVVPYSSNLLSAEVDGAVAGEARSAFLGRRSIVQSDCTGSRLTAIRNALSNCASLARSAATAASSGNAAKVTEYYKSSSSSVRSTVSGVFSRVATECGSTSSGVARYYCSDVYGACGGNVLAYTVPSASYMVNCPLYFSGLPALSRSCHAQDQATTTLHEVTHLSQIAGTDDFGTYGYNGVRGLSAAQNLRHADTYAADPCATIPEEGKTLASGTRY